MPASDIVIKGAREHNLRSIDLVLPRNQLICLTGVSGSGKSSLAFDTLYAEGQRRYVESLSSFARHFLGQMPKPDVDSIAGLSPSISISQKSAGSNPRSTVGTITEIYDFLRILYARVGDGHCPQCQRPITAQSREQILARMMGFPTGSKLLLLAPVIRGQKGEYRDLFADFLKQGFVRARVDGKVVRLADDLRLDRQMRHNIEIVIDRITIRKDIRPRLAEAVETALRIGKGNVVVAVDGDGARVAGDENSDSEVENGDTPSLTEASSAAGSRTATKGKKRLARAAAEDDILFSTAYACVECGVSFEPPSPQLFSFNSPQGMCLECDGLGEAFTFDVDLLIPNPSLSFKKGCFEVLGGWKDLGRWKRHIYQGFADTVERTHELPEGTLLDTPWQDLPQQWQDLWLWGTGDLHITYTWRSGATPNKYGGKFEGIIPDLLSKYSASKSSIHVRKLEKYMATTRCPECRGQRINRQAAAVRVTTADGSFGDRTSRSLPEVCALPIVRAREFFERLELDPTRQFIATEVLKEIRARLEFLNNVGLDYLTLERTAPTLSGGETQRIRLASQIGSGLVGVLYILDEPSIGLHPRDNDRLLETLQRLRDVGNTVVVVEHDEDTILASDHVIDFGPGPGVRGGHIVASGTVNEVMRAKDSVTGQYLSGKQTIEVPQQRRSPTDKWLRVLGAEHNNLKNVDVDIPLGLFVCVTGVSGSGKSSLVNDILMTEVQRQLHRGEQEVGKHRELQGLEHLDKLIAIDQTPIGRTPRSNPGTYIKVFDDIRKLFALSPESKRRGYKPGRFSFNVDGGRCQACGGNGSNRLEMDFLADVWVTCPVCNGHRFNVETLSIKFKDKSISDVLEMDIQQALQLFENQPVIEHKLRTLHDVGLDYIKVGQPSPTLSGGEAQRIKLARELVKRSTGKTLYLLDEPTTGLHFADIRMLLDVLHSFVYSGNTVLVVEHNLDVIKTADWIIDMGPEGGEGGGRVVVTGTPEAIAQNRESHTGRALAKHMAREPISVVNNRTNGQSRKKGRPTLAREIDVQGAQQHNLKDIDVKVPRDQLTVFCGPSGSGKSSLAMETIYAEGQRRYVESLSSYARQFVSQMQKPHVEHIEGLSPAIALEQQNLGHSPRSTVGTVTEVYDYLRILLARGGTPYCPSCDIQVGTQSSDEIIEKVVREPAGTQLFLMAPVTAEVGQDYATIWEQLRSDGYMRMRVDGQTHLLESPPSIDRRRKHEVDVIVDRVTIQPDNRSRVAESIEAALALGRGVLRIAFVDKNVPEDDWRVAVHSQHLACDQCGRSFETLSPHHFSFNSQLGWCPACDGLGTQLGANPAILLKGNRFTLAEGALALWPNLSHDVARWMLHALGNSTGIPLDTPFEELSSRQRRLLLLGTGERWIDVLGPSRGKGEGPVLFRFQFKGVYPAIEEASRLAPSLRTKLGDLVDNVDCMACGGSRLRDDAAAMRYRDLTIEQLCRLPLGKLQAVVDGWKLNAREQRIAGELVREIKSRVKFLNDVGLDYLTLARPAATLSGGEAQRIRLASQLGSGLCGVLYVLDEPTIGLHPRDNTRLIGALHGLRDLGNTLLVVEHDREVIESSDHVIDFGPAAGKHGGQVVASGTATQLKRKRSSVTGPFLTGKDGIPMPKNRRPVYSAKDTPLTDFLEIRGAGQHNLKNVDAKIPLGTLTAITGPSGSGKSSLIDDILYNALSRKLHRTRAIAGAHEAILGIEHVNKVIQVDQKPLGYSPSSNPATYTGAFNLIRDLFAQLPDAKVRGYAPRRFSFNVPGGRCETCEGNGQLRIEMHFLPDVWVPCSTCNGQRYNPETLAVKYRGHSIADVLSMTCGEALQLLKNFPKLRRILQTLCDVGLDYISLGQPAPTLSGGEAQRVKLAAELSRPDTGRTLYLLDEPTTGLHFSDLVKLLEVLQRLVDVGNTVVVIEHNLDIIKSVDWIIDMGPEAGEDGGRIVAQGTPEQLVAHAKLTHRAGTANGKQTKAKRTSRKKTEPSAQPGTLLRSHTGEALIPVLEESKYVQRELFDPATLNEQQDGDLEIEDVGRQTQMPWEIDGRQWHVHDRVGRQGEPCRWEGKILSQIVDKVQELGDFSDTNWNARSVVEISSSKKSDGWFMHALTSDTWLLKLKFRVARNTFRREQLQNTLDLKTLNQLQELPIYGNEPRVKCKNLRGPWQEIELRLHTWHEIDRPEFWKFLESAVEGFQKHTERAAARPDDISPWKKLGEKWHFSRKGFPLGKPPKWDTEVLEELCEVLRDVSSDIGGEFLWNNQQLVHFYLKGDREPWASIVTKRPLHVELMLHGRKDQVALGRILGLGCERELSVSDPQRDVVKLRFRTVDDLSRGDLPAFLKEHATLRRSGS